MSAEMTRIDVGTILSGLKDFQRDTVDYVFQRLYLDEHPTRRFLVADEVGLGKTLVARGLIARAIDHLKNKVNRVDIVYICSNADIARQNINRLNVTGRGDFTLSSRITLLPTQLHNLRENKLNFVSFTPQTSFDLKSNLGRARERILLYWLLHKAWGLHGMAPQNVLQGGKGTDSFRYMISTFDPENEVDQSLAERFVKDLETRQEEDRAAGRQDLRSRFEALCEKFPRSDSRVSGHDRGERKRLVGELRTILAESCLAALEPDLIILDEFQRFKHLLDEENPVSQLAHGLFNYADEQSEARVVLLSATPYKMYTLSHESAEDDHYADFLKTLRFLEAGLPETGRVEEVLKEYRKELFRLGSGDGYERLARYKRVLESRMRRVMVRTERLAVSGDRDGMLAQVPSRAAKLESQDLEGYVSLQKISRYLGHGDVLEFWKSAPYLLNFMDGYRLKRAFQETVLSEVDDELHILLSGAGSALLPWEDVSQYAEVDPGNARLRDLLADTTEVGAWRLLWVPPSMPYYLPEGPFADPELKGFTKRLVFSSWVVVPKVIATLLSYEAERHMMRSFEEAPANSPEARQRRRPLLRFPPPQEDRRRPPGMPVLGLLYPSTTLARECDPLQAARDITDGEGPPKLEEVLGWAQRRIEALLREIGVEHETEGLEDEAWYWAAPILIDLHRDRRGTLEWLGNPYLAANWSGEEREDPGQEEDHTYWSEHVEEARKLTEGGADLGCTPADLSRVLALKALAGPGTAALRAIWRVTGGRGGNEAREAAGCVAWSLRSLFNTPEATALLREPDSRVPYWRRVLEYGAAGNLQATLDEYVHVLRESEGLLDEPPEEMATELSRAMREALGIRASSMGVDDVLLDNGVVELHKRWMRGHFALRFGEERSDDGQQVTRAGQVREAFNSPFRPFVLATTSVGQEGLDFHTYCHAVVHWNLPSNPVDLEQREGRVHRYKGHAVRKNLAHKYGLSEAWDGGGDPWEQLFEAGKGDRSAEDSDLVPYWIYPLEGGAKIERHVFALPLSRDRTRMESLRRSLAAYRMVFGQARQEDLLAYLLSRLTEEEAGRITQELRINLEPPREGYTDR